MSLEILLVHELRVMRKIVTSFARTELAEAEVEAVASAAEALEALERRPFDLVLCSLELPDMDGVALARLIRRLPAAESTPVVILSASPCPELAARLRAGGLEHCLQTPFSPEQLLAIMDQALNPRARRSHRRYSVPGARAELDTEGGTVSGKVINFSMGGVLVELVNFPGAECLLNAPDMAILFPPEFGAARAGGLRGSLVRLTVHSWDRQGRPEQMRAAFKFARIPKAAASTMRMVAQQAEGYLVAVKAQAWRD